jgi:hypothetical protein
VPEEAEMVEEGKMSIEDSGQHEEKIEKKS